MWFLFLSDSETRAGENIVPWHIKNVTPKILTKMLRSTGTISQKTEVKTITRTPVGDNEDGRLGVLSCIFRLSIEYNRMDHGGGPLSVIYKASPLLKCTQDGTDAADPHVRLVRSREALCADKSARRGDVCTS